MYQIGQTIDATPVRDIVSHPITPTWYAVLTPPQKESAVRAHLRARGIHSCFPERETTWAVRGKKHRRLFPVVSRIVYVKFTRQPEWDVLKARRIITGVMSYGETPIRLKGDIIAAVMGLPTEAERIEAARRELLRVREGDKAKLVGGSLDGMTVDVTRVAEGRIWFDTITGIKGSVTPQAILRVVA